MVSLIINVIVMKHYLYETLVREDGSSTKINELLSKMHSNYHGTSNTHYDTLTLLKWRSYLKLAKIINIVFVSEAHHFHSRKIQ